MIKGDQIPVKEEASKKKTAPKKTASKKKVSDQEWKLNHTSDSFYLTQSEMIRLALRTFKS